MTFLYNWSFFSLNSLFTLKQKSLEQEKRVEVFCQSLISVYLKTYLISWLKVQKWDSGSLFLALGASVYFQLDLAFALSLETNSSCSYYRQFPCLCRRLKAVILSNSCLNPHCIKGIFSIFLFAHWILPWIDIACLRLWSDKTYSRLKSM